LITVLLDLQTVIIFFKEINHHNQGRPTCGPEIFLCGPNWVQNLKNYCAESKTGQSYYEPKARKPQTWVGRPWFRATP
jgi:hypothetical protein